MRLIFVAAALSTVTACATVSKLTIEDRLRDLGFSRAQSECVSDELDQRLDDGQLSRVALTLDDLTDADGPRNVLDAVSRINDPEIATAAGRAGLSCLLVR